MNLHFKGFSGLLTLLAALFVPGLIAGYVLHSLIWLLAVPCALIVVMIFVAALPLKRRITPQQFADQLEPHLLGTAGAWEWDDATSIRLADKRLERLRVRLGRFDNLTSDEQREELRQVIIALRRGEVPEISDDYDLTDGPRFRCS